MRHVPFDPENLPVDLKSEWDHLQDRAVTATEAIIDTWEKNRRVTGDDFDTTVWRDIKNFLMEHVFYKKCAYCETNLPQSRQDADAEHFRPKGGVNYKEKPEPDNRNYNKAKISDVSQNPVEEIAHPGYFWLAYNWKNLLPACRFCNSKDGKKNQFPVARNEYVFLVHKTDTEAADLVGKSYQSKKWPEIRYLDFVDLDQLEERYLLHPYWDEAPERHIGFDHRGQIYVKEVDGELSPLGEHSVSTYDLWNEDLRIARQKEQERVKMLFDCAYMYFLQVRSLTPIEAKAETWNEPKFEPVKSGQAEYSRAIQEYLDMKR